MCGAQPVVAVLTEDIDAAVHLGFALLGVMGHAFCRLRVELFLAAAMVGVSPSCTDEWSRLGGRATHRFPRLLVGRVVFACRAIVHDISVLGSGAEGCGRGASRASVASAR